MMTQEERRAQIKAQMEVGKRVNAGEKLTKEQIHEIVEKYRKEVKA